MTTATRDRLEVRVGLGSCGIANGARPVWDVLHDGARQAGDLELVKAVGCGGNCHREPLVEVVRPDGQRLVYTHVTPEMASAILKRHVRPRPVTTRLRWTWDLWSTRDRPEPSEDAIIWRSLITSCRP